MLYSDFPADRGARVEDSVCSEDLPFQVPQDPGGKYLPRFKNQHLHLIKEYVQSNGIVFYIVFVYST